MFREIKNMEYDIKNVRQLLSDAGYVMFSSHDIQSGIIKAYEFWQHPRLEKAFCLEIWKNDKATIFKQTTINEIQ